MSMNCSTLSKIWPSGSRQEVKNVKTLHTDGLMDGRTTGDQKILLEPSVHVG